MKLLLIFLMTINVLQAFELLRKYDASVGLYGKIGHGEVREKHEKNRYTINFTAKPTSFIADLSGIIFIEYQSIGKINKKGVFIPERFTTVLTEADKKKKTVYIYDHLKKSIVKKTHIEKKVEDATIDSLLFDAAKKAKTKIIEKITTIQYVPNDYLTLIKNARFLKKGNVQYLDQNRTDSLNILGISGENYKVKIKTKEKQYFLELQNDIYGLKKAKTLKSLEFGDADLKAIKMNIEFE